MPISTGFFDAARQYTAQEFARALRAASTPGVLQGIGNQLAVTAGPGLGVTVDTGFVTILGNWLYNDGSPPVTVSLLAADPSLPRIDRIIARLTISTKTVEITKLTGTPAGSPVAPSLTQGSDVYEVPLAQIAVAAAAGSITSGNVTDQRQYSGSVLSDHKHTGTAGGGGTLGQASAVASAATIALPTDGEQVPVTGTTTITGITAGTLGRRVTLKFTSAGCQVTNGGNLVLEENYISSVNGTLTLISDGSNWIEVARASDRWSDWTPGAGGIAQGANVTFTVTRCRYKITGKVAVVQFSVALTSAGTAGTAILMNVPAALAAVSSQFVVGTFHYYDASVGFYTGSLFLNTATQFAGIVHNAATAFLGAAPNFAAASGDAWSGTAVYEVA